ncbi:hypothetical protein NW757_013133 [Fusarium falciforme]|nr:hypothetical protein NW757_013133 [Fusarium falciforme]
MGAASAKLGDALDPSVTMGPLADSQALEKVKAMIARGKEEAELVLLREEVFGPVAVVQTFKTEEEVVKLANDTEYGLMAGVFTKDINRALRVSPRIESGVVGINCISVMKLQAPFGGKKASGIGREFGEYAQLANDDDLKALRGFTEPKTVLINMNA